MILQTQNQLSNIRDSFRDKTIVATNGCFDILHLGHVRYLQEAKAQGHILVVGINSDSAVKLLKGESRPINKEQDRAELIDAFSFVNFVFIFNETNAIESLNNLKPDVYVKGGDYTIETLAEVEAIREIGAKIHLTKFYEGYSSTKIIERLNH